MADIIRTKDVSEALLLQWFRRLVPTSTPHNRRDEMLDAIWNEGNHRLPCYPVEWTFYRERVIIKPLIFKGRAKHQLIQEMLMSPGRIYLVSDAQEPDAYSLTLCVAGFSHTEISDWLNKMKPAQMILGEFQGTSLIAAPLIAFTQDP